MKERSFPNLGKTDKTQFHRVPSFSEIPSLDFQAGKTSHESLE
jgi:hypothetical protein